MNNDEVEEIHKKMGIKTIYLPEFPMMVYEIPGGNDGYKALIYDDPYEGLEMRVVKTGSKEDVFKDWRDY